MNTTTKILNAAVGSLLFLAPVAASAQMVDRDNVQDEVDVPGVVETVEPAELVNVPDAPEAAEASETPGLSR